MKMLVIAFVLLLIGCTPSTTYEVKKFKYFSDDEVHVDVILASGKIETFICAFPPDTNYGSLKKVKIDGIKSENLLEGASHYCNAVE